MGRIFCSAKGTPVIHFYERGGRFRRCEVRVLDDNSYELVIVDHGGSESVEEFAQYDDMVRRIEALHCEWRRQGWTGPYGRDL